MKLTFKQLHKCNNCRKLVINHRTQQLECQKTTTKSVLLQNLKECPGDNKLDINYPEYLRDD